MSWMVDTAGTEEWDSADAKLRDTLEWERKFDLRDKIIMCCSYFGFQSLGSLRRLPLEFVGRYLFITRLFSVWS